MSKFTPEDQAEVTFRKWCNYRSTVDGIIVANRGGDGGLNLYFKGPSEPAEGDARQVGIRLSLMQSHELLDLLSAALINYDDDAGTMQGGVYCYPEGADALLPEDT